MEILLFIFSFFASLAFTSLIEKRLRAKAVLDIPNDRSMHVRPVPRGGGWAIMGVIIPGLFYFDASPFLLVALFLLIGVSWMDDKKGLRASVRLATHLLAALLGSLALGDSVLLFGGALPFWLDRLVLVLGWGWMMNLYNFMDGIDGITGAQTIGCCLGFGLVATTIGTPLYPLEIPVLIAGACAGFLVLNWHPAKIFMGDVGSVPLGFLMGYFMLRLCLAGHYAPALLIPLYYLADSGITLARRALNGEKIWQAHRSHFYQRMTVACGDPRPVVLTIALAHAAFIAAGLVAVTSPWTGVALGAITLAGLLGYMQWRMDRSSNGQA